MNMLRYPEDRARMNAEAVTASNRYDIAIHISLSDRAMLWRAAAAYALTFSECDDIDIEDMLGLMEDPSVADCIAMLVGPRDLPGCTYEAFAIVPAQSAAASAEGARKRTSRPAGAAYMTDLKSKISAKHSAGGK